MLHPQGVGVDNAVAIATKSVDAVVMRNQRGWGECQHHEVFLVVEY